MKSELKSCLKYLGILSLMLVALCLLWHPSAEGLALGAQFGGAAFFSIFCAGVLNVSDRFAAVCSPVIGVQNDTCGSVTRASIDHLSLTDLNNIFQAGGLYADLDAWFMHAIEMKACGMRRYAWYDWIYANADREAFRSAMTGIKGVRTASLLQPFVFGKQETVINRDYWKVINGVATGGYTVNQPATAVGTNSAGPLLSLTGGTRVIRVQNRHSIPIDPNWFRPSEVVFIFNKAGNGVSLQGNWRVVSSAINTTATYIDVLLADENAGSTTPYDAAPTSGLIVAGLNNVNDFETWCTNLPNIDPRKRVPFWFQTSRQSRCIDEEYQRVWNKLFETNPAFREFGDLPIAERNRQDEMEAQKRFVNAFLFQKPISSNQTLSNWESLTSINTVTGATIPGAMGGKLVAKRANFIGVKEQLRACDRVFDLQGNKVNLYEFLDLNYDIKRKRETAGRKVTDIDWWVNSTFRANFQSAAIQYYKDQYLDTMRLTQEIGKINQDLGWVYDSYFFKRPGGVRINLITDEFFDDYYDEFDSLSIPTVGNLLLCLDIGKPPNGSIYWAQMAANRKSYTTAQIAELAKLDATFRCTMEYLTLTQTLTSETGMPVVECPQLSAWIENFDIATPITTGKSNNPTYSNLY